MTQGCDCPHDPDKHFPNGRCAVMHCRCVRTPLEETMTLEDVIDGPKVDEGRRSPHWLPPMDTDAAWKRALGEIVFSVGGLQGDIHDMNRAILHRAEDTKKLEKSLGELREVVGKNDGHSHERINNLRDVYNQLFFAHSERLDAIEARLGDFKMNRKGKKKGKR